MWRMADYHNYMYHISGEWFLDDLIEKKNIWNFHKITINFTFLQKITIFQVSCGKNLNNKFYGTDMRGIYFLWMPVLSRSSDNSNNCINPKVPKVSWQQIVPQLRKMLDISLEFIKKNHIFVLPKNSCF